MSQRDKEKTISIFNDLILGRKRREASVSSNISRTSKTYARSESEYDVEPKRDIEPTSSKPSKRIRLSSSSTDIWRNSPIDVDGNFFYSSLFY